jgi:hypothetical protein
MEQRTVEGKLIPLPCSLHQGIDGGQLVFFYKKKEIRTSVVGECREYRKTHNIGPCGLLVSHLIAQSDYIARRISTGLDEVPPHEIDI